MYGDFIMFKVIVELDPPQEFTGQHRKPLLRIVRRALREQKLSIKDFTRLDDLKDDPHIIIRLQPNFELFTKDQPVIEHSSEQDSLLSRMESLSVDLIPEMFSREEVLRAAAQIDPENIRLSWWSTKQLARYIKRGMSK